MMVFLALACSRHHRIPSGDDGQTQDDADKPFQYTHATVAKAEPCGLRLGVDLYSAFTVDFGAQVARAHWLLPNEDSAFFRPPARGAVYSWRSATESALPLHCSAEPGECQPGGSRLQLLDASGQALFVHVHWEPSELPVVEPGTQVTLDADVPHGWLTLSAQGRLLFAVQRYTARDRTELAWSAGPFQVRADRPVCTSTSQPCNYRTTALALRFSAGGKTLVLEPGEDERAELEGESYHVSHAVTTINGAAIEGQPACAAARPEYSAFSILRE